MGKFNIRRLLIFAVSLIATIAISYIIAVEAAGYFQEKKYEEMQMAKSKSILDKMTGVEIGGKLPDFELVEPDGNPAKLSVLASGNDLTVFSFMRPGCGYCKRQIALLNETSVGENQRFFNIITTALPEDILAMKSENDIKCKILYDADGGYSGYLGVFTFPFSVVVDRFLVIKEIYTSAIKSDRLIELAEVNMK